MMDSHINRKNIKQSKQVRKLLEDVAIELDLDTDTVLFFIKTIFVFLRWVDFLRYTRI